MGWNTQLKLFHCLFWKENYFITLWKNIKHLLEEKFLKLEVLIVWFQKLVGFWDFKLVTIEEMNMDMPNYSSSISKSFGGNIYFPSLKRKQVKTFSHLYNIKYFNIQFQVPTTITFFLLLWFLLYLLLFIILIILIILKIFYNTNNINNNNNTNNINNTNSIL